MTNGWLAASNGGVGTMPDDEVTPRQLLWQLGQMEKQFERRLASIEALIGSMKFVERGVYDAEMRNMKDEVAAVKESNMWLRRIVASGFVVFLLSLVASLILVAIQ